MGGKEAKHSAVKEGKSVFLKQTSREIKGPSEEEGDDKEEVAVVPIGVLN